METSTGFPFIVPGGARLREDPDSCYALLYKTPLLPLKKLASWAVLYSLSVREASPYYLHKFRPFAVTLYVYGSYLYTDFIFTSLSIIYI